MNARTSVYSMCGMCAVRCPMEVTVEDGKVTWLQGNPHDKAIGTSLCAKGEACKCLKSWCARPDSNGRPADSKSDALSN